MTDPDYIDLVLDLLDAGCACHLRPPCTLCTTLTEEHAEIYREHGAAALRAHIHATENGDDPPALPEPIATQGKDRTQWTPPLRPEPTPRELAVRAVAGRFVYDPTERDNNTLDMYIPGHYHVPVYSRRSATDPVTGVSIRSSWWDARVDDGDSEAELADLIRRWAEKQVPA